MPKELELHIGEGSIIGQMMNGTLSRRDLLCSVLLLGGSAAAVGTTIDLLVNLGPVIAELRREAALNLNERPCVEQPVDNPSAELVDQRLRERGLYERIQLSRTIWGTGLIMALCSLLPLIDSKKIVNKILAKNTEGQGRV